MRRNGYSIHLFTYIYPPPQWLITGLHKGQWFKQMRHDCTTVMNDTFTPHIQSDRRSPRCLMSNLINSLSPAGFGSPPLPFNTSVSLGVLWNNWINCLLNLALISQQIMNIISAHEDAFLSSLLRGRRIINRTLQQMEHSKVFPGKYFFLLRLVG